MPQLASVQDIMATAIGDLSNIAQGGDGTEAALARVMLTTLWKMGPSTSSVAIRNAFEAANVASPLALVSNQVPVIRV